MLLSWPCRATVSRDVGVSCCFWSHFFRFPVSVHCCHVLLSLLVFGLPFSVVILWAGFLCFVLVVFFRSQPVVLALYCFLGCVFLTLFLALGALLLCLWHFLCLVVLLLIIFFAFQKKKTNNWIVDTTIVSYYVDNDSITNFLCVQGPID